MRKERNGKGNLKPLALFLSGGALFSMHFGASSMIWPMNWGKESGTSVLAAFAGAAVTGLILVIIGYIALQKGDGTFSQLTNRIAGKKPGLFFSCLTIAINGPLYVIPRMSAAAWDSVVQAFGIQTESRLPLIAFITVFYIIAYVFLMRPGKTMDRISAVLFPVLVIIVIAVIGKGLTHPLGEIQPKAYDSPAFAYGFTNGYATGEIICALIYGAVIISSLKDKGIPEENIMKNMILVAVTGIGMLTCAHFCHMMIGASAAQMFPDLSYTSLYTAVATALYGKAGGILFCFALCMAALTATIGMTSGCSEFFVDAAEGRLTYRQVSLAITALSVVFGSMGLANILSFLGPILDGVYPPVIIIVLYYGFCENSKDPANLKAARAAFFTAFAFGAADTVWKYLARSGALPALQAAYLKLPLASISLAWVPFAAAAFVIGKSVARKT